MVALSVLPIVDTRREWTVEDLRELPEDVDRRSYEIVDGALVVSPSASYRHEVASAGVRGALMRAAPAELVVIGPIGVVIGRSYRIPDLIVAVRDAPDPTAEELRPDQVLLAVEVVSPSSVTTDRVTKPAQYAAAGIGSYWRVETDPVSVTAYDLRDGVYVEVGSWGAGETARIAAPFPVEIEVDRLV